MTQLPPEAIWEFQDLWKKHYGEELPAAEAIVRAHQVFSLIKMLVRKRVVIDFKLGPLVRRAFELAGKGQNIFRQIVTELTL